MQTFLIKGHGVVLDGHDVSRATARSDAAAFLVASAGWTEDDADAATDQASVVRAWWGGDDVGFAGSEYPAARAVTVVNLSLLGASA